MPPTCWPGWRWRARWAPRPATSARPCTRTRPWARRWRWRPRCTRAPSPTSTSRRRSNRQQCLETENPGESRGFSLDQGSPRSERHGDADHRALETLVPADDAVAHVVAGHRALHVQAVPLVAGEQAEVLGEAVFGDGVGARDAAVVIPEVAPVGVQVLRLQVQQPALARARGQAHADHRGVAVLAG